MNGEPIRAEDYQEAMILTCGPAVLERLVTQKLVEQEAARQKVEVQKDEWAKVQAALKKTARDSAALQSMEQSMRYQLLLRQLILKDVTEVALYQTYDTFKRELTRHQVFEIVVASTDDLEMVRSALKKGTPFGQVALTTSQAGSKQNEGLRGFLTEDEIYQTYPRAAADIFMRLNQGKLSESIPIPGGYLIMKRGATKDKFEELKGDVETLFVQAGDDELLYRLGQQAKITFPGANAAAASATPASASSLSPSASPTPSGSPTP